LRYREGVSRRPPLLVACLLIAAVLVGTGGTSRAEELEFRPVRDGIITGTTGALWLVNALFLADQLSPDTCRWCDRDGEVDHLNGFDSAIRDGLKWSNTDRAATLSNVAAYVFAPASAFGVVALVAHRDGRMAGYLTDVGLVLEATFIAADVNQYVKSLAGRERPFVHVLPPEERPLTSSPNENNLSFYSGHTSLAFSLAAASGSVASLRGYRGAWLVWATGMTAATATGYLRIAADRHYASDVLVGAAMGSLIGVGVPVLLGRRRHPTDGPRVTSVSPFGAGLSVAGAF
jgi:membrane-associated phospholipid phosphatase